MSRFVRVGDGEHHPSGPDAVFLDFLAHLAECGTNRCMGAPATSPGVHRMARRLWPPHLFLAPQESTRESTIGRHPQQVRAGPR